MNRETDRTVRIGVGAVVFRARDVLIVRRARPPFAGLWSIPGGGLEYGERAEDAVRREVREETGVEIGDLCFLGVFEALPGAIDPGYGAHVVLVDYVAGWRAGRPRPGDDAAEARFAPFDEALALVSWAETRRAIVRAAALRGLA
jgi:8-oxo-dGTP diphosphatase